MNIVVLDKKTLGEDTPFDAIAKYGTLTMYDNTAPCEVIEHCKDADAIIVNKVKITEEVFSACKQLKLVCVFATGYDNVDVSAAARYGVGVCNVPAYSKDSVALFTVATVLSLYTHLREYNDYVTSGRYSASGMANSLVPVYHELRGKTWGIIGLGNIGRAVAKVAEAFGAHVVVCKRTPASDFETVDIDTLCRNSDIITVHVPLTEETEGLISEKRISLMKKDVIIVNEARGAVLNEEDITRAIECGRIGGFGCDVYSKEPMAENHPFNRIMNRKNVLLTPHAAWGAYEARERCASIIGENLASFLSGGTLNRVDI